MIGTTGGAAILFVCTANQCRSPMAEIFMRARLEAAGVDIPVLSAGTRARPGAGMNVLSARAVRSCGQPVGAWSARRLDVELLTEAALVLTAQAAHRRAVSLLADEPPEQFTLLQFARLVRNLEPGMLGGAAVTGAERLQLLIKAAHESLRQTQPPRPGADDLDDPIGRRYRAHRKTAALVSTAVDDIVRQLRT